MKKQLGFKDSKAYLIASTMPKGKKHYPDKTKPFSCQNSEVFQWLIAQPVIQAYLCDKITQSEAIRFDPQSETWFGINEG